MRESRRLPNRKRFLANCTFRNLAATMFAPGAAQLASEFNITSPTLQALTVSLYVLGFALGPIILAPLSECYGRLFIYYLCNTVYFAFTAGCAFSTNTAMFLVFRLICGSAASGPMAVGGGTIADITPQEQRGKATALFAIGPLLGPVGIFQFSAKSISRSLLVLGV
jgi:MFS family permease